MQQLGTAPFGEQKIAFTRSSCGGSVLDSFITGFAGRLTSALFSALESENPRRPKSAGVRIGSLAMTYFHWKYNQLSSAQRRFTVLFGMGRSGTATLWSPGLKGRKSKALFFRAAMQSLSNSLEVFSELFCSRLHGYRIKLHEQLVLVSSTPHSACTSNLSTSWSRTTLQGGQSLQEDLSSGRFPA